jgi:hypothetical protein
MKKRYVGKNILRLLASERGSLPGMTLGDIARALGLPVGTAIGERIRELRGRGYDIRCAKFDNRFRYYILTRERERVRKEIAA